MVPPLLIIFHFGSGMDLPIGKEVNNLPGRLISFEPRKYWYVFNGFGFPSLTQGKRTKINGFPPNRARAGRHGFEP